MTRRNVLILAVILVLLIGVIAVAVNRPGSDPALRGDWTAAPSPVASTAPSPGASTSPGTESASPVPGLGGSSPLPTSSDSSSASGPSPLSELELLAQLSIRPEVRAGYQRSLFVHWIDADGDGCDTRREVLLDEAIVAPTVSARCHLTGGRWYSAYDGVTTSNAATFDIDHVVPLAEAWDSGASAWSPDRRMAFANDLGVPWSLIAVSAASNRAKSDADPADWMPPRAEFRCTYAAMWLAVKVRWELSVDSRERAFLAAIAGSCPDMLLVPRATSP